MQLLARALRRLANRYLVDPQLSAQNIARANAAEASATLQKRRREQADVDAYLLAWRRAYHDSAESGTSHG